MMKGRTGEMGSEEEEEEEEEEEIKEYMWVCINYLFVCIGVCEKKFWLFYFFVEECARKLLFFFFPNDNTV